MTFSDVGAIAVDEDGRFFTPDRMISRICGSSDLWKCWTCFATDRPYAYSFGPGSGALYIVDFDAAIRWLATGATPVDDCYEYFTIAMQHYDRFNQKLEPYPTKWGRQC
jgi:hypothetical protein